MKNKKIIIGSRGSKLALIYAERAKSEIMKFAKISGIEEVEIKSITTIGDTIPVSYTHLTLPTILLV